MADGLTVQVRGLKELAAALQDLAEQVSGRTAKAAMKRALVQAAEPMAERMAELSPKRFFKLHESIVIDSAGVKKAIGNPAFARAKSIGLSDTEALKVMRTAQREGPAVVVLVGPTASKASLASMAEFGTRPHRILPKPGSVLEIWQGGQIVAVTDRAVDHPGAPPHPFLRPAFEQTAPQLLGELKVTLRTQIDKAVARARAKALRSR